MSIALDRVQRVEDKGSGFSPEDLGYGSVFERLDTGDMDHGVEGFEKEAEESNTCSSASSSSSSIGRNSDQSARSSDGEESGESDEVQSSYKGPLDMMDSLEEVLPVRLVFFLLKHILFLLCFGFYKLLLSCSNLCLEIRNRNHSLSLVLEFEG